ncbi:CDP-alcohol phosphatidyltransferase family protein [Lichenicoccus sp.]|uniref:CDP-alcohol phosphatidyltransferase family protein n=1 Tax=Lichenicoccus sp. TaxID=2781899 RepID=UPI003D09D76E
MQAAEPVRRTPEIEEFTNRLVIHPVAGRLVRLFARLGVAPNAVSLLGMACGIGAALAYLHYDRPACVVAGFCLMILWHVMDGADGQLARLTASQSELGKVLDGVCDYVTFIGVYAALAVGLAARHGAWVWGVVIVAGLCHAVQAAAYEKQREEYVLWGRGRLSAQAGTDPGTGAPSRLFRQFHRAYAGLQSFTAIPAAALRQDYFASLASRPERAAASRERYRRTFAPAVRRWSVMSANYRTIGIFLFTLCGIPLYYFCAEILGLSLVLVLLLAAQRALYRRFCANLEVAGADEQVVPPERLSADSLYRLAERNR